MRQPPPNPHAAAARAAIAEYSRPLLVNPAPAVEHGERVIVTFAGAGYPDIPGPTWDAAEVEAWYKVALKNTSAALKEQTDK